MNVEDLQLRLLAKFPLYVSDIPIYSPELLDIADVGVKKYQQNISNCIIDKNSLTVKIEQDIADYDIFLAFLFQYPDFLEEFLDSLYFFTKNKFNLAGQGNDLFFFYVEEIEKQKVYRIIDRNNYNEFVRIIKMVNCIEVAEPLNELDEFDKRILDAEKKIKELENEKGVEIPFKDLVSSVVNMGDNNLNIINIWNLNIFTFYDQLKRGQKKEAYFIGLKQLLAGAEPKEVNLDYYIKKLD